MTTVPILMLGSDFDYAFAPTMGEESLNAIAHPTFWLAKPYTGTVPAGYVRRDPNNPNSYNAAGALAYDYVEGATASPAAVSSVAAKIGASPVDTNNLINQGFDAFKTFINRNKPSMTIAEITELFKQAKGGGSGFSLEGNMPLILIGGAALVAILFMAGTRKKS